MQTNGKRMNGKMHVASSKPIDKPCVSDSSDDNENPEDISQEESESSKDFVVWKPSNNTTFNGKPNFIFKSFIDRMENYENIKKKKNISIAMQIMAEEQAECTFTPNAVCSPKRNFQQFIKDQEKFLESKTNKIENMERTLMENELKNLQKSPKINSKSLLMCKKLSKGEIKPTNYSNIKKVLEENSIPKTKNKGKCRNRFLEQNYTSPKRLKKVREEKQEFERKKIEELSDLKKKSKGNYHVKKRLEKELDDIINIYYNENSQLSYELFCTVRN